MRKGWNIKKLGDVCEFYNGQAHENNIEENGKYILINSKFISSDSNSYKKTNVALSPLFKGDIVMVMSDVPNGKALAKCFLVDKNNTYTLNQRICAIRSSNFVLEFLLYQLNRNKYLLEFNNGENQTNLRKNDILNCPLLIPPLPEQKRIVAILDKTFAAIDQAKANTQKNLQNAKELFESYLQNVFANPGEDWGERKLEEVSRVFGGYSFKSGDFKNNGKYQVLRMGNIRPGIIREEESPVFIDEIEGSVLQRALLKPDDIIITQTGTKKKRDYGFTTIIDKKNYLLNQRIAGIRFSNNYLPKFFLYYSWTNFFKDQFFANETGTVGQGNVGIGAVTNALVPFCSIKSQMHIVSNINTLLVETKKLESNYHQKMKVLEELKKSILQKAFAGELTK